MDLHQLSDNLGYFHMIDEFTRFNNAIIVTIKATPVMTKKFIQCWISLLEVQTEYLVTMVGDLNQVNLRTCVKASISKS